MREKTLRNMSVVSKVVHLFESDRRFLQEIADGPGLEVLTSLVKHIEEAGPAESKRPIRLKIPGPLDVAIRQVAGEGGKKTKRTYTKVLLAAARRYREDHQFPADWTEPDAVAYGKVERERRQQEDIDMRRKAIVVRLDQEDRELLRNLGRGHKESFTRHAALWELVDVVKEMQRTGEFDQIRQQRRPVRLPIPADLDAAVTEKIGENRTYVTVLLAAALEYRRQSDDLTK